MARLSPSTHVPVRSIVVQAAWSCLLALSGTYDQLTDCVIFASWIFYGLVTSSVFVLRRKLEDAPRPYRTLGYPLVPLVFVVTAAWLVVNTLAERPVESIAGLALIAAGLPFASTSGGSVGRRRQADRQRAGLRAAAHADPPPSTSALDDRLACGLLPDVALELDPVVDAEGQRPARDVPDELLLHGAADDSRERDVALVHDDADRRVDPARVLDEALVPVDPAHQLAAQPVVEARDALDADLALQSLETGMPATRFSMSVFR
jgi:hypothetical protein